jgi:hypothetical protein
MNTSIFILIFVIIMGYYLYKKYSTPPNLSKAQLDFRFNVPNLPSQLCGVLQSNTIRRCTDDLTCQDCICSDESELSGCMSCQTINNNTNIMAQDYVFNADINQTSCTAPYVWDSAVGMCKLKIKPGFNKDQCVSPYDWDYQNATCKLNIFKNFYIDANYTACIQQGPPYEWSGNVTNGICRLRDGQYCLPTFMPDVYCNPITSRKVLFKDGRGYKWGCVCKDSTKFGQKNDGSHQNCDQITMCGLEGSAINPNPIGRGIYRQQKVGTTVSPVVCSNDDDCTVGGFSGDKCVRGKCYWQAGSPQKAGSNWDPYQTLSSDNMLGACQCAVQEEVDKFSKMNCVMSKGCAGGQAKCVDTATKMIPKQRDANGNCPAGSIESEDWCECPAGFVDCQRLAYTVSEEGGAPYYNGICTVPSCVPDPCGPNGRLDEKTLSCVCDPGFDLIQYPYNIIKQKCVNPCADDRNPCGLGEYSRGTCYVNKKYPTDFKIDFDAIKNLVNASGKCVISYYNTTTQYLRVDSSNNIVTTTDPFNDPSSYFTIVPYCNPRLQSGGLVCPDNAKQVSLNNMYYIVSGTKYLDFSTKKAYDLNSTVTKEKLAGNYMTTDRSGSSWWPSLIKLVIYDPRKDTSSNVDRQMMNTKVINANFYNPMTLKYISMKTDDNTIEVLDLSGSAKCGLEVGNVANGSCSQYGGTDQYFVGGKDKDKCVYANKCKPGFIQSDDKLCMNLPSCGSNYSWTHSTCHIHEGQNDDADNNQCGPDYEPTCYRVHGNCQCMCMDKNRSDKSGDFRRCPIFFSFGNGCYSDFYEKGHDGQQRGWCTPPRDSDTGALTGSKKASGA